MNNPILEQAGPQRWPLGGIAGQIVFVRFKFSRYPVAFSTMDTPDRRRYEYTNFRPGPV